MLQATEAGLGKLHSYLLPTAEMNPLVSGTNALWGTDILQNNRPLSGWERTLSGLNTASFFMGEIAGPVSKGWEVFSGEFSSLWGKGASIFNPIGSSQVSIDIGKVYRVWGDASGPWGQSWTTQNPIEIANYRNYAGLPNGNTGRFVSEGYLLEPNGVTTRLALPLDGNQGGIYEVIVPNPKTQIELERVSGVNPQY